jgi:hypothetical protein
MRGSIRALVGFLIVFGAVGADDSAPLYLIVGIAVIGLAIMASGVSAMKESA